MAAMHSSTSFAIAFDALMGYAPFPWQAAMYDRFAAGKFPSVASIPTGLGKTAVIAVWMIALTNHPELVPRRLVWVINRRTVVDQATDEAMAIRERLSGVPLSISTLRGQFADNRE